MNDQSGGAVLGRGTFGCAIKPSVSCENPNRNANKDRVSKIMSTEDAWEEMAEYDVIKKIDPKNEFTLKPPTLCYTLKDKQSNVTKEDIKRCSITDRNGKVLETKKLSALLMENGGNSIGSINPGYLEHIVKQNKKNTRAKFFRQLRRCFYGIYAINKAGKYHNDIKPDNILIKDDGTDQFNLIDFGLMRDLDRAIIIGRSYFAYPWTNVMLNPDNNYATAVQEFHTKNDASKLYKYMREDIRKYYESNDYTGSFYRRFIQPYLGERDSFITQSFDYFENRFNKSHSSKEIYKIFSKDYTNKLDVYSLGITILYLITKIDNRKNKSKLPSYLKDLVSICLRMINVNTLVSYSAEEALAEYDKYLVKHRFVTKPKAPKKTNAYAAAFANAGGGVHQEKQTVTKGYKKSPKSPLYDTVTCAGKSKENCKSPCIFTNGKVRKYCRMGRRRQNKGKTAKKSHKSLSAKSVSNKQNCKGLGRENCKQPKCKYVKTAKRSYCRTAKNKTMKRK